MKAGDRVRVIAGPLAGSEGVIQEIGRKTIDVLLGSDWPFPRLYSLGKRDVVLIVEEQQEAWL